MGVVHWAAVYVLGVAVLLSLSWRQWPSICCPTFPVLPGSSATAARPARCAVSGELTDLASKGYLRVPNFLLPEEVKALRVLFDRLPQDPVANGGNNIGYRTPQKSNASAWEAVPDAKERILQLIREITEQTDIQITEVGFAEVFINTNASVPNTVRFAWHQDHDSFFLAQEHYNYLNFYIIVDKQDPMEAGLEVVPFDTVQERSPAFFKYAKRHGAVGFTEPEGENRTRVWDDNDDTRYIVEARISDWACTPELRVSDMLILRGDTIHRTQPHNSARTSLTIRVFQKRPLDINRLLQGGLAKYFRMAVDPVTYIGVAMWSTAHGGKAQIWERWVGYWMLRIYGGLLYRMALWCPRLLLGPLLGEAQPWRWPADAR